MTPLKADWIAAPATRSVMAAFETAGFQALFVGGCVRNTLLEVPVTDIDIATDARPEQVIEVARISGLKSVPTGFDHGTVTLISDHRPFEVTTFRKDVETDGRRAVVAFSDSIEEDARRRDFTMNAIYARADGTVVDPLDGMDDLRARRVRFIDDPDTRIREDYLRILRFFRFHAGYGDPSEGLDPDGLAACSALSEGLGTLPNERIGAEMMKLLGAADPAPSVAAMFQTGILSRVLPGADPMPLAPLVHLEGLLRLEPDAVRRLASLGGEDAADRFRLSRVDARRLATVRDSALGEAGTAEIAYRHGAGPARDAMVVRSALMGAPMPATLQNDLDLGATAVFPVNAADLQHRYSGASLGDALRRLENEWVVSGFVTTREELLAGL